MMEDEPRFWTRVQPVFQRYFQFWPDHEDLIWAKSIWPVMEDAGFFDDRDEEAYTWTQRNILSLAILYAESARCFGTPDYRRFEHANKMSLLVSFGSKANLDETLFEVGSCVRSSFPRNDFKGCPIFFVPLIRSLVCGAGFYHDGRNLSTYLEHFQDGNFNMFEFREDELHKMWIGGHFNSQHMSCF